MRLIRLLIIILKSKLSTEDHGIKYCHPGGIFQVVDKAISSNLEDPYRMTLLVYSSCASW
jgi:hypothetical protein